MLIKDKPVSGGSQSPHALNQTCCRDSPLLSSLSSSSSSSLSSSASSRFDHDHILMIIFTVAVQTSIWDSLFCSWAFKAKPDPRIPEKSDLSNTCKGFIIKGSPSTRKALFKRSLSVRGGGLKTHSKWQMECGSSSVNINHYQGT